MTSKIVFIVNIGTPESPSLSSVRTYLSRFLTDPWVIQIPSLLRHLLVKGVIVPFRSFKSLKSYQKVWKETGSPLLTHMKNLERSLQKELEGQNIDVKMLLRYHSTDLPFLSDTVLKEYDKIHFIGLYPQYSQSTSTSLLDAIHKYTQNWKWYPDLQVDLIPGDPAELKALWVSHLKKWWNPSQFDHLLFSYHGLPAAHLPYSPCCLKKSPGLRIPSSCERYCYAWQCQNWTQDIGSNLGLTPDQYSMSYQSRLLSSWLKPFTDVWIETLLKKGIKRLAVCCPSFVVDCLETSYEIEYELKEMWIQKGGVSLTLIPSLNDSTEWVQFLARWILRDRRHKSHIPRIAQCDKILYPELETLL